jgi:hypothetical protein
MLKVYSIRVSSGQFLPAEESPTTRAPSSFSAPSSRKSCSAPTIRWARGCASAIAVSRHRRPRAKGQFLGIDLDDAAYIPTARALELYNRDGLMKIDLSYEEGVPAAAHQRPGQGNAQGAPRPRGFHHHHAGRHAAHAVEHPRCPDHGGWRTRQHFAAGRRRRHRHHHDHRRHRTHQRNRPAGRPGRTAPHHPRSLSSAKPWPCRRLAGCSGLRSASVSHS